MVTILGGKKLPPFFVTVAHFLTRFAPHIMTETAPYLGPMDKIQKSQQYYFSSAMGLGVGKKVQFWVKTAVPQQKR